MRVLSDEQLEIGIGFYQDAQAPTDYWKISREVVKALFNDLGDPDADHVRLFPYMEGVGEPVLFAARASSKKGKPCGQTYNDIRPCPPFCE